MCEVVLFVFSPFLVGLGGAAANKYLVKTVYEASGAAAFVGQF